MTVVAATADGTATAGGDYTALSGEVVTIPAGDTSATVSVNLTDDTTDEPNEAFDIVLSSPSNATLGSPHSATATIIDNDAPPVVSVSDVSFDEDNSIVLNPPIDINGDDTPDDTYIYSLGVDFTVELDRPSARQVSVTASTADVTATGTAGWCPAYAPDNNGSSDYRSTNQTFTFAPGETSKTFTVAVCPDTAGEGHETFAVELSSAVNATVGDAGEGAIRDNDVASVDLDGGVTAVEGSALAFTLRLSQTVSGDVTVTVSTGDDPAATHPADATGSHHDYTPLSGHTVTIPAGNLAATVSVSTTSDTADEFDETFVLRIDNATSTAPTVVGATDTAVGTITDDDAEPTVTIANAVAVESDNMSFTVTLSHGSEKPVAVDAATAASTASAAVAVCARADGSEDFLTTSGTVVFAARATTATFDVTICDDTVVEGNEQFTVSLSSPVNAALGVPPRGTGVIVDNDTTASCSGTCPLPVIQNPALLTNTAGGDLTLRISVDVTSAGVEPIREFTVTATGGTAVAGTHYDMAAQTLTFDAANPVHEITIPTYARYDHGTAPRSFTITIQDTHPSRTHITVTVTGTINPPAIGRQ